MERIEDIASIFDRLWPLLRSITGEGVRQTHEILSQIIPLQRIEVPSGSKVFDWVVPKEWIVREAYAIDPQGKRILDIKENNLHLLNYSVPFRGKVEKSELEKHLYSLPEMPEAIPYVTSYYEPRWGFCLAQKDRDKLPDGDYHVCIDTEHIDGSMTLGEVVLPGEDETEVLISTNTCHPSLASNELSGPIVAAFLYSRLAVLERRRMTYRFVFLPETIGSLAYLALRGEQLRRNIRAGYVITCVGDPGPFTYKRSRAGNTLADRAAIYVLSRSGCKHTAFDFVPDDGSDERQYCSPGFDLPVGSLMRTMYGRYTEYHTSFDNREFIAFEAMQETIDIYFKILQVIEMTAQYRNLSPYGEPQLSKRALYPTLGTRTAFKEVSAIMWLLNYSDGQHDSLWIAERSGLDLMLLDAAAQACIKAGLLERVR